MILFEFHSYQQITYLCWTNHLFFLKHLKHVILVRPDFLLDLGHAGDTSRHAQLLIQDILLNAFLLEFREGFLFEFFKMVLEPFQTLVGLPHGCDFDLNDFLLFVDFVVEALPVDEDFLHFGGEFFEKVFVDGFELGFDEFDEPVVSQKAVEIQ